MEKTSIRQMVVSKQTDIYSKENFIKNCLLFSQTFIHTSENCFLSLIYTAAVVVAAGGKKTLKTKCL